MYRQTFRMLVILLNAGLLAMLALFSSGGTLFRADDPVG